MTTQIGCTEATLIALSVVKKCAASSLAVNFLPFFDFNISVTRIITLRTHQQQQKKSPQKPQLSQIMYGDSNIERRRRATGLVCVCVCA